MSARIRLSETPLATVWGNERATMIPAVSKAASTELKKAILGEQDQALLRQQFSDNQIEKAHSYGAHKTVPAQYRPLIAKI